MFAVRGNERCRLRNAPPTAVYLRCGTAAVERILGMKNARGGAAGVSGANVAWPRAFPAMFAVQKNTVAICATPRRQRLPAIRNRCCREESLGWRHTRRCGGRLRCKISPGHAFSRPCLRLWGNKRCRLRNALTTAVYLRCGIAAAVIFPRRRYVRRRKAFRSKKRIFASLNGCARWLGGGNAKLLRGAWRFRIALLPGMRRVAQSGWRRMLSATRPPPAIPPLPIRTSPCPRRPKRRAVPL